MADIQGDFSVNGIPRDGATAKLWSSGAFTSRPEKDDPIPSGTPIDETLTGPEHGANGAYRFLSVAGGEYYVSLEWNGGTIYDYHLLGGVSGGAGSELGWTFAQDYPSLSDAINATPSGSTLYIPQGTYSITTGLTISKQINVMGNGKGTILQAGADSLDLLSFNNISGVVIDNLYFDANGQTSCQGLVVSGCGQVTVRASTAKGLASGFRFNNCQGVQATACFLSGCTTAGIHVSGGGNFTFAYCNYNQVTPAYDVRAEGSWSVLRVDNVGRVYAVSGTHLLLTNFKHTTLSALDISGTTQVFNPTAVRTANVRDYGAKGNASIDDWASIQSAVIAAKLMGQTNTGTKVIVPPGRYIISQPIVMPRTGSTPTNVVHLCGEDIRTSQIVGSNSLFPSGRALIEWEVTLARAWHQRICDLTLVCPNISGTMAINYTPTLKTTGAQVRAETLQIELENILVEGSNQYHTKFIYLEGNVKLSTFKNIYGDPAINTFVTDTRLLEFDTDDLGADDASGLHYSQIDGLYAGVRRGGYTSALKGRFHRSTISTSLAGVGCADIPTYHFKNSSAIHVRDVANEGRGEKPQILIEACTGCVFEHVGVGQPNEASGLSLGIGNGIEISGSHDITFNGQFRRAGGDSFFNSAVKHVIVHSDSRRCRFYNFDIITLSPNTVATEITFNPPASGGCYGEFFDKRTDTFQTLGRRIEGTQQIQNGGWDTEHFMLGDYHIWVDTTGDLRIKSTSPTGDLDGTIVGTQS